MASLVLGIDIGGTNTSFGIVNEQGNILCKGKMSTRHETVGDYILALQNELRPLFEEVGEENVIGAGIGAPNGNYFTGEIVFAPNLPWKGVIPMAKLISEALELPVTLTNDAKAAAIGEMKYGAAKNFKDFIMVTLGTGLGSGFVVNGQVIYGHNSFAGELGHTIAVRDGRRCNCGRNGCLERYASATGIVITAEQWLLERNQETMLREHQGRLTARMIHQAGDAGDPFTLEMFEYTGKILGESLADAVAITSPEAIVFFGGFARTGDLLLGPTRRYMEPSLLNIYKGYIQLVPSALPDADAAILGASALAW